MVYGYGGSITGAGATGAGVNGVGAAAGATGGAGGAAGAVAGDGVGVAEDATRMRSLASLYSAVLPISLHSPLKHVH